MLRQQVLPQADTTAQLADSVGSSLDRLGEGVTASGRLILEGRWDALAERTVEGATELAVSFVPSLLSALFVGLFFYGVYRAAMRLIRGVLGRSQRVDRGLATLTVKTLRVVAWTFIVLLMLSQLGINLSALIAGLGIAGLAVGFAAKDSLENFISGVTILLDRPFGIGDWVTVGTYFGQVTNITLRSTRIRTLREETIVFPSLHMVTQPLVNHSDGGPLRVDVPFGIAYKEDIDEARRVALEAAEAARDALAAESSTAVVVIGLNDSSVDLELRVFVESPGDAQRVRCDLIERVRKGLGQAGIEIPFPHLQVFLDGARALEETPLRVISAQPG